MRRLKSYMAMLMALVIAITSINIPSMAVYAQDVDEGQAQLATASDAVTVGEGTTRVDISVAGESKRLRFTPTESCGYEFYSTADVDTYATLYDAYGDDLISDDDSGEDNNFRIRYKLTAGETYELEVRYFSDSKTGSFDVYIGRMPELDKIGFGKNRTDFLEKVDIDYSANVYAEYSEEDKNSGLEVSVSGSDVVVDGIYEYNLSIKDENGSYTYEENGDSFAYSSLLDSETGLPAGTYTEVITDRIEGGQIPDEDTVIYDTRQIRVLSAADYFADREDISESTAKEFKAGDGYYEYYRFVPSKTTEYLFTGLNNYYEWKVYDSSFEQVRVNDDGAYSLAAGESYYIGINAWDNEDNNMVSIKAIEYSEPVSIEVTMDSEYVEAEGIDGEDFLKGLSARITYADNTEYIVENISGNEFTDNRGIEYTNYMCDEADEWNSQTFEINGFYEKGTYIFSIGYGDKQLFTKKIEIKGIDSVEWPELKAGKQEIESGADSAHVNYYTFVMPYEGHVSISTGSNYVIYDVLDGGELAEIAKNSWNLKKGTKYYVGFYGNLTDDNNETETTVSSGQANVSFDPAAVKASAVPEKKEFIRGLDDSYIAGTTLKVTYSDGSAEDILCGNTETKYGQYIDTIYIQNDTEYSYTPYAPKGDLTVSFRGGDNTELCSYGIHVYDMDDLSMGTVTIGSNQIKQNTISGMPTYYKFTAPSNGEYSFGSCESGHIYKVNTYYDYDYDNDDKRYECCEVSQINTDGSVYNLTARLSENETYYIEVSDGARDKWGDIQYSWDMKVTRLQSYAYARDWKLTGEYTDMCFPAGITVNSLGRLLGGVDIEITYADDSTETLTWDNDEEMTNKNGDVIIASIYKKDADGSDYDYYAEGGDGSALSQGSYTLAFFSQMDAVSENEIDIPFEVKDVDSFVDGTWNVTQTLAVKNDKTLYVYKLDVPTGTKALTFAANASGNSLSLVDKNGNAQRLERNYDSTYGHGLSWTGDLPADGAYLYICTSEDHPVTKFTTDKVREAVEVTVDVDDQDYYIQFNEFYISHIRVNVKYSDGTEDIFADNDGINLSRIQLKITDTHGEEYNLDYGLATGTYTVTASVFNMSDDCKVNPDKFTVKTLDTDSVEKIETGKTYTQKNEADHTSYLFYRYEAPATGKLKIQTDSYVDVYKFPGLYEMSPVDSDSNIYKVQKGGEYLIVAKMKAGADNTIKAEYVEYEHEAGGSLVLGESKAIKITEYGRKTDYTFTPSTSGTYVLSMSYGSDINDVSLYQDDTYITGASYDTIERIYKLSSYLRKGVTYTYVVTTYGDIDDTFAIKLDKGDKNPVIKSAGIVSDSCVYMNDSYVTGDITVDYSDGTTSDVEFDNYIDRAWSYTDKYDNKIQVVVTLLSTAADPVALVELRYKAYDSDTWKYTDQAQVSLTSKSTDEWENAKWLKTLAAGETYTGTAESGKTAYFKFIPEEDGQYLINITNADVHMKDITSDSGGVWIGDNAYSMKAGHVYGIALNVYNELNREYKICINTADSITDVEITGYDGKAFAIGGCRNSDRYVQVRVTYADGSTEIANGGENLSDGRNVSCKWIEYDANKAVVIATAGGMSSRYLVRYSPIENAPKLEFTDNVAEFEGDNSYQKLVYKVTVPQTGEYAAVRGTYLDEGNINLYNMDGTQVDRNENYRYSLEKGDTYYLCVDMYGKYTLKFGLAYDGTWEITRKATCIEPGVMRRKNLLTGAYESKNIPKTDHDYTEWQTTPATTKAAGVKKLVCSMCKVESGEEQIIPMIKSVTLAKTAYTYDKKTKTPAVTVKDVNGTKLGKESYTVTYKNNKNVGKAKVTITFKGDYSGTVDKYFNVNPAGTTVTKLENTSAGVEITWKKSASASGYLVYRKTSKSKYTLVGTITKNSTLSFVDKKATNGTGYTYKVVARKLIGKASYKSVDSNVKTIVRLSASRVNKLTNEKGNKMKVTWGKNTKAAGYQIQYAVKSNFAKAKVVKVTGARKTSATIAKLAKKKYYVRVRSFKKVGKTTYYSAWSKSANITIKK